MNPDVILKIMPFLNQMNTKQKQIALNNITLVFFEGDIPMIKSDGKSILFIEFIKSKCNCT